MYVIMYVWILGNCSVNDFVLSQCEMNVYKHVCMYIRMYVMYACMCVHVCTYMYVSTYVWPSN